MIPMTEQERFWSGEFGENYRMRNQGPEMVKGNLFMFSRILRYCSRVGSFLEFGSNIGMNLMAIKEISPNAEVSAVEINEKAVRDLERWGGAHKVYHQSIFDFQIDYQRDLVFTKGVLIHINPEMLSKVYDLLYQSSKKYILISEYFNPTPVEIPYRGHSEKLFKRDFAAELMDRYPNLELINYGFFYERDSLFSGDNSTWFLMRKSDLNV